VKAKRFLTGVLFIALILALAGTVELGMAQSPEPGGEVGVEQEVDVAAVSAKIPIQGRLTNASGVPLNGSYSIRMRLYDRSSGGTVLCEDTDTVSVKNGLFNAYMDHCNSSDVNGRQLYLGIKVRTDPEMTPRQPIYPVPYAYSLRPGALISDTKDVILTVRSTGTGDADALLTYAGGTGEAVTAYAQNGVGVAAFSDEYVALQAYSKGSSTNPGIFGCVATSSSACDPYRDDNAAGVMGYSQRDFGVYGVGGSGADGGVYAEANMVLGVGVWAENNGNGMAIYGETSSTGTLLPTLYLVQKNSNGNFVVGANGLGGTRYWRVDRTGKGFFNGGTQTGGADFAEQIPVAGKESDYEPGDVLVISASADKTVERTAKPYDTAVIGVYSTKPAVLAGAPDSDDPLKGIPVAITGIVPCKASAENGSIQRGDLLVTSSTPGHAMRAGANPPQGTVLGKAMQSLDSGTGTILVLVTLQ